jgi:hypothetical protein
VRVAAPTLGGLVTSALSMLDVILVLRTIRRVPQLEPLACKAILPEQVVGTVPA